MISPAPAPPATVEPLAAARFKVQFTASAELRDKLDIQTVKGWGSHPDVLRRAGADDADMLVAVTSSDDTVARKQPAMPPAGSSKVRARAARKPAWTSVSWLSRTMRTRSTATTLSMMATIVPPDEPDDCVTVVSGCCAGCWATAASVPGAGATYCISAGIGS